MSMFSFAVIDLCRGNTRCTGTLIASGIAFGLILIVLSLLMIRFVRVNGVRRAHGLEPLRWKTIGDARLKVSEMQRGDATAIAAETAILRRQVEWERHLAAQEMARYGRSMSRSFCARHERHCKEPISQPHPPGGIDNDLVPADWQQI